MSLVGSLEDLSLGDILQIISLSQKSGVLSLQTTGGGGRIVFVKGLVRGAALKGGPTGLREILVGGGFLSEDEFATAEAHCARAGGGVAEAVVATTALTSERIDSLTREAVEAAVVTMFGWRTGDFSFDVRSGQDSEDPELILPTGINAGFLAMEGARVRDESDAAPSPEPEWSPPESPAECDEEFDSMSAEEMFGVVPDEGSASSPPVPESVDKLASAVTEGSASIESLVEAFEAAIAPEEPDPMADLLDERPVEDLEPIEALHDALEAELVADGVMEAEHLEIDMDAAFVEKDEGEVGAPPERTLLTDPFEDADLIAPEGASESPADLEPADQLVEARDGSGAASAPGAASVTGLKDRCVVVIDTDLMALEWVKSALKHQFSQVHIFQQSGQGLDRIRQYVVRGIDPVVLVSPQVAVDSLSGIRDADDFVARLKKQAPRSVALWLAEDGAAPGESLGAADGAVMRPERSQLRIAGAADRLAHMAEDLVQQICHELAGATRSGTAPAAQAGASADSMERLRDATQALTEASSRGEVLPLVIRFASEAFDRIAMFMIRDGVAVGMAGHGLDRSGGPSDDVLRRVRFETGTSQWMCRVLQEQKSVAGGPRNAGDRNLAALLGDRVAEHAYLGPIVSAGQVIALLYADNLPDDRPVADTSGLEVVMHHAGLALDRAALERALSESEV